MAVNRTTKLSIFNIRSCGCKHFMKYGFQSLKKDNVYDGLTCVTKAELEYTNFALHFGLNFGSWDAISD